VRRAVTRTAPVPRGVTLVELLVVIVLLGLVAGVAGAAFRSWKAPASADPVTASVERARAEALASGRAVTVELRDPAGRVASATAFPDGAVVADGMARGIDRLSGRSERAAR